MEEKKETVDLVANSGVHHLDKEVEMLVGNVGTVEILAVMEAVVVVEEVDGAQQVVVVVEVVMEVDAVEDFLVAAEGVAGPLEEGGLDSVGGSGSGKCSSDSGCPSYAPYCSKFGYCRSESGYANGGSGPPADPNAGKCFSNQGCPKWAPHCSKFGFCQETPQHGTGGPAAGGGDGCGGGCWKK